jgi:RNA polymerase sigma-70 factor (ECF subfamily)
MTEASSTTRRIQGWIERLKAGDESARGQLIDCAYQRLVHLARKMLRDFPRVHRWEQTDDVLQGAALRLLRTLTDVQPADAADFFRLAALNVRRELLDLAKHYYGPLGQGAHHATVEQGPDQSGSAARGGDPADAADDGPERLAAWTEFHQQVERLPVEERETFSLLWYQGLTQAEAAEVLRVSERTVKRRWQLARLHLHEALGGNLPEG